MNQEKQEQRPELRPWLLERLTLANIGGANLGARLEALAVAASELASEAAEGKVAYSVEGKSTRVRTTLSRFVRRQLEIGAGEISDNALENLARDWRLLYRGAEAPTTGEADGVELIAGEAQIRDAVAACPLVDGPRNGYTRTAVLYSCMSSKDCYGLWGRIGSKLAVLRNADHLIRARALVHYALTPSGTRVTVIDRRYAQTMDDSTELVRKLQARYPAALTRAATWDDLAEQEKPSGILWNLSLDRVTVNNGDQYPYGDTFRFAEYDGDEDGNGTLVLGTMRQEIRLDTIDGSAPEGVGGGSNECPNCGEEISRHNPPLEGRRFSGCELCGFTCDDCDAIQSNDNRYSAGDSSLCESCYCENYTSCARCGETISLEDCITADGESYCSNAHARRDGNEQCAHCDEWHSTDDMIEAGGNWYCNDDHARRDDKDTCSNCGEWFSTDGLEDGYCADCKPESEDQEDDEDQDQEDQKAPDPDPVTTALNLSIMANPRTWASCLDDASHIVICPKAGDACWHCGRLLVATDVEGYDNGGCEALCAGLCSSCLVARCQTCKSHDYHNPRITEIAPGPMRPRAITTDPLLLANIEAVARNLFNVRIGRAEIVGRKSNAEAIAVQAQIADALPPVATTAPAPDWTPSIPSGTWIPPRTDTEQGAQ